MTSEISKKLQMLMAQEMGPMGAFIIKKQCSNLGLNSEELKVADLPPLASALFDAIKVFTGEDKGKRIQDQIRKLGVS
ncbi:MAG: hypothetical protein QCI38_05610 [Candidatus Thermoplasmatota archaeon]|nr:hypothetical protein [Candidatus Thermoplasmatota archaeon]